MIAFLITLVVGLYVIAGTLEVNQRSLRRHARKAAARSQQNDT